MNNKRIALILTLILACTLPVAFAADSRMEGIEYEGFGILKIDFNRDCDWYTSGKIALTDATGADVPYVILGGESEECYLRAETIAEGSEYTVRFTLGETEQTAAIRAESGIDFKIGKDGGIKERKEDDRCDLCKSDKHDDDYCTERIDAKTLPTNPDELARLFDIDRCDRCGGIGHDDDRCKN